MRVGYGCLGSSGSDREWILSSDSVATSRAKSTSQTRKQHARRIAETTCCLPPFDTPRLYSQTVARGNIVHMDLHLLYMHQVNTGIANAHTSPGSILDRLRLSFPHHCLALQRGSCCEL